MFDALRACGGVELASSEEQPADHDLGGRGYSVAFDPLDGSSIIGANWAVRGWRLRWPACLLAMPVCMLLAVELGSSASVADPWAFLPALSNQQVGSIFGIWPGRGFVGRPASEQAAAAYAVYGPKTVLVLARPVAPQQQEGQQEGQHQQRQRVVQEFVLLPSGVWQLSR